MPLYGYKCTCGESFERYLPLARYDEQQLCTCGAVAEKQMFAAKVIPDYEGYTCPVTGKWVEGRKAHRENLKAHGCRVLETGEKEEAARHREREAAALEASVAETAAKLVEIMPSRKREQLGRELELGAEIVVTRV